MLEVPLTLAKERAIQNMLEIAKISQSGEISSNPVTLKGYFNRQKRADPLFGPLTCDCLCTKQSGSQTYLNVRQCDQIRRNFKSLWATFWMAYFSIWQTFVPTLAILCCQANFNGFKWPKIE